MPSLNSLPAEILSIILQSCNSVSDVVSVATTCRTIQSIWVSESTAILWRMGLDDIIGFEHALIAVRATSLVEEAHEQGILPPFISLPTLATKHTTPAEWKKILSLRHLVRCVEHTFCLPENAETSFDRTTINLHLWRGNFAPPSEPLYQQLWSENFHIASYRAFTMGAVLSRSYQEPFFSLEKPDGFLEQFAREVEENGYPGDVTTEDADYLCKFPVYDLQAYGNMGPAFDPVADWLLGDCKSQVAARDGADPEEDNDPEGPLFREIARVMVACSHLTMGNGLYFIYTDFLQFDPVRKSVLSGPTRTVHTMRMGDFQAQEITMPASVEAVKTMLPHIRQRPSIVGPKIPNLSYLLESLYCMRGRLNRHNPGLNGSGYPSPEPPLQIFVYILRKNFGLVFGDRAFEEGYTEQPWLRFSQAGDIFGNITKTYCPVAVLSPHLYWAVAIETSEGTSRWLFL